MDGTDISQSCQKTSISIFLYGLKANKVYCGQLDVAPLTATLLRCNQPLLDPDEADCLKKTTFRDHLRVRVSGVEEDNSTL